MEKYKFNNYDKEKIKKMYNEFYTREDFVKYPLAEKAFIGSLCKKLNLTRGLKILDLGCGTGKYSKLFYELGFDITGVDLSEKAIEIARNNYPYIKFKVGDATNLPFHANSFEVIYCSGLSVFNEEDLSTTIHFLSDIFEYLNDDGLLIFVKTSALTDKYSKSKSRYDHSVNAFKRPFIQIKNIKLLLTSSTIPHVFIFLKTIGFSSIISFISEQMIRILNKPVRVCLVYKKQRQK